MGFACGRTGQFQAIRSSHPALLVIAALALPGCGAEEPAKGGPAKPAAEKPVKKSSKTKTQPGKTLQIDLEIVEARGGNTLALVPVFINGEGPFPFALDTGASQTVIDKEVVDELGMKTDRKTVAEGISGSATGAEVAVREWKAGGIELPEQKVVTIDLPEDRRGNGLRGLLGSDILNAYDVVTVDYDKEVLVLRPRVE